MNVGENATFRIILMLLLINTLILASNVQPVEANGRITIRADGTIDPPTAPILRDGNVYTFTANIFDGITVERSNVIVDGNGYTLYGSRDEHGFVLEDIINVTIQNTNVHNFTYNIYLQSTDNTTITGNNITNNNGRGIHIAGYSNFNLVSRNNIINNGYCGVSISGSINNTVSGNNITNNGVGVDLGSADYNIVSGNNIANSSYNGIFIAHSSYNAISGNNITNSVWSGINVYDSDKNTITGNKIADNGSNGIFIDEYSDNKFYHNNFIDNTIQIHFTDPPISTWDDGYPSGGNYWSDYNGNDNDGDGIGDTPYIIDENNQDNYPLMTPVDFDFIPEFPSETEPTSNGTEPEPTEPEPTTSTNGTDYLSIELIAVTISLCGLIVTTGGLITRAYQKRRREKIVFTKLMEEIDEVCLKLNAPECEAYLHKLEDKVLMDYKDGLLGEEKYNNLNNKIDSYLKEVKEKSKNKD